MGVLGLAMKHPFTAEILAQVNGNRQGQKYSDEDAVITDHGHVWKEPFLSNPAIRSFQLGGENGYWTGGHVTIHPEDCIDVFKVFYRNFTPHYLFDNSTGHCQGRKDGSNVNNMNKKIARA